MAITYVANPAHGQAERGFFFPVPVDTLKFGPASRFDRPVPCQPTHSPHSDCVVYGCCTKRVVKGIKIVPGDTKSERGGAVGVFNVAHIIRIDLCASPVLWEKLWSDLYPWCLFPDNLGICKGVVSCVMYGTVALDRARYNCEEVLEQERLFSSSRWRPCGRSLPVKIDWLSSIAHLP